MVLKVTADIHIPSDIKCAIKGKEITITGPRGTIVRDFSSSPTEFEHIEDKIHVVVWFPHGQQKSIPSTITAHIYNMITGVTKGFLYKMRLAYAHFPITVNIIENGQLIEIRNFLREAEVRRVHALQGVKIEVSKDVKDEILIYGNDIEAVSCTCAKIHESVKIKHKDLRKFLDGIYVSYKGTVSE